MNKDWKFGLQNYHKELHAYVSKHLHDLEEALDYIYLKALPEESANWPPMKKGSDKEYGVFDVILSTFGQYASHYERYITLPVLKAYTGYKQLIDQLRMVNTELSKKAMDLEQLEASLTPLSKLVEVHESYMEDDSFRRKTISSDIKQSRAIEIDHIRSKSIGSDEKQSNMTQHDRFGSPRLLIKYPYHRDQQPEPDWSHHTQEPSPEVTTPMNDTSVLSKNSTDDSNFLAFYEDMDADFQDWLAKRERSSRSHNNR